MEYPCMYMHEVMWSRVEMEQPKLKKTKVYGGENTVIRMVVTWFEGSSTATAW